MSNDDKLNELLARNKELEDENSILKAKLNELNDKYDELSNESTAIRRSNESLSKQKEELISDKTKLLSKPRDTPNEVRDMYDGYINRIGLLTDDYCSFDRFSLTVLIIGMIVVLIMGIIIYIRYGFEPSVIGYYIIFAIAEGITAWLIIDAWSVRRKCRNRKDE